MKSDDLDNCVDACETIQEVKNKISGIQEDVVGYVKDNPLKSIGFSIVAGIVVAQFFRKRK